MSRRAPTLPLAADSLRLATSSTSFLALAITSSMSPTCGWQRAVGQSRVKACGGACSFLGIGVVQGVPSVRLYVV